MRPSSPRRPALLRTDHLELATESGTVVVTLRRDRRARNYTLRVKTGSLVPVLTMPAYGSLREARIFLEKHTGWLQRQMEKTPAPQPIVDGATIPLRGVPHRIIHRPESRGTVSAEADTSPPLLAVCGAEAHLRRRVLDFLRREARHDLQVAVTKYATALGVRPTALRVRDTSSRWGSCTAAGELSFSFRLILAPPFVLDYLAAHEVAHLREMNHSHRFWRLVGEICPDHAAARAWLNREGPALHAIGAQREGIIPRRDC